MKAIQIIDGKPQFVDLPEPTEGEVKVKVVSSSICGTDLHAIPMGILEGRVLGHEFAGYTPDGTPVAIEPAFSCGECEPCQDGFNFHCNAGNIVSGFGVDGGMQEYAMVPERALVKLPSGLDMKIANLVEPLAVGVRGLDRGRVKQKDRVLVVGGGSVGIATAACLHHRGISYDLAARYDHQKASAERLGAGLSIAEGGYDVVIDCVGNESTISTAIDKVKSMGRIVMLGNFWDPVPLSINILLKEAEFIPSLGYKCKAPNRSFEEAVTILEANPEIDTAMVTHRFPLDAAAEGFATADDRKSGAIKVTFDIAS